MKQPISDIVAFGLAMIVPVAFYRTLVALFFTREGSPLRTLAGLNVHHMHYGIVALVVCVLLLLFWRRTLLTIIIGGVGIGLVLDAFIPSLLLSTTREQEIAAYTRGLVPTLVLVVAVLMVAFSIWWVSRLGEERDT